MADTSNRFKLNARSPFYVVADPEPPYIEPAEQTDAVECGEFIDIGEDVGVRKFILETDNRTGDIDIDYSVNIPVAISATWNGNDFDVANGDYVGDSEYQQDLLNAGIASDDMSLTSGTATGTLTVNKTSVDPSEVTVTVKAPLRNDEYRLTFNCPDKPQRDENTLPASPTDTSIQFNVPAFISRGFAQQFRVSINGTEVYAQFNKNPNQAVVITDHTSIGSFAIDRFLVPYPTDYIDKSLHMKSGWNNIRVTLMGKRQLGYHYNYTAIQPARGGIFHNGSEFKWATLDVEPRFDYSVNYQEPNAIWLETRVIRYLGGNDQNAYNTYDYWWYEEEGSSTGFFGNPRGGELDTQ